MCLKRSDRERDTHRQRKGEGESVEQPPPPPSLHLLSWTTRTCTSCLKVSSTKINGSVFDCEFCTYIGNRDVSAGFPSIQIIIKIHHIFFELTLSPPPTTLSEKHPSEESDPHPEFLPRLPSSESDRRSLRAHGRLSLENVTLVNAPLHRSGLRCPCRGSCS